LDPVLDNEEADDVKAALAGENRASATARAEVSILLFPFMA